MVEVQRIGHSVPADITGGLHTTQHQSWRLVDYGNFMVSEDPLFGVEPIHGRPESQLLCELYRTPAAERALDITQLSKLSPDQTIPNLAEFTRAGGNISQVRIINMLADKMHASKTERLAYILTQSLSDAAHGPLSHATDMEIEGFAGGQVFHDTRRPETYDFGGITNVLRRYGVKKLDAHGSIPGIAIPPCIESGRPNLNADNYQFTLNEGYEWFSGYGDNPVLGPLTSAVLARIKSAADMSKIVITPDKHMAFTDIADARFLQKLHMLLGTEHWKEPINRVVLHLYVQALKYAKIKRRFPGMEEIDNGTTRHPESYTYMVDSDVRQALETGPGKGDEFMYATRWLLSNIGQEERSRFVNYKLKRYAEFLLDDEAREYPNELLNGHLVMYGPTSSRVEVEEQTAINADSHITNSAARLAPDDRQSAEAVSYELDPLKNRFIDPYVQIGKGKFRRLSEIDSNSVELLRQHQDLQWRQLNVRLVTTRNYAPALRTTFHQINEDYEKLRSRGKLSPDQIRRSIASAALRAKVRATERGVLVLAQ